MDQLVSPQELHGQLSGPEPPMVIDVRESEAYREGHIPGAVHIPAEEIAGSLGRIPRSRPVVTY